MEEEIIRVICGTVIVGIVAALQIYAWEKGKNGKVFALTSSIITGVLGFIFGISI